MNNLLLICFSSDRIQNQTTDIWVGSKIFFRFVPLDQNPRMEIIRESKCALRCHLSEEFSGCKGIHISFHVFTQLRRSFLDFITELQLCLIRNISSHLWLTNSSWCFTHWTGHQWLGKIGKNRRRQLLGWTSIVCHWSWLLSWPFLSACGIYTAKI